MATQLTFAEEFRYDDDPVGITVPVTIHHGEKSLRFHAKVDTGAEVCLFRHEHAVALGLLIEQGLPIVLSGLGGSVEAFGHEIVLQTDDIAFESIVYLRDTRACRAICSGDGVGCETSNSQSLTTTVSFT